MIYVGYFLFVSEVLAGIYAAAWLWRSRFMPIDRPPPAPKFVSGPVTLDTDHKGLIF